MNSGRVLRPNNVKRNEKTFLLGILTFTVTEYFLFVVLALTANSKRFFFNSRNEIKNC